MAANIPVNRPALLFPVVGRHRIMPGPVPISSAPLAQCVERWTSTPEARVPIRVAAIQRFISRADTVQANSAFHP